MGAVVTKGLPPCGDSRCRVSTSIAETITAGRGEPDPNGFFAEDCGICERFFTQVARVAELERRLADVLHSSICTKCGWQGAPEVLTPIGRAWGCGNPECGYQVDEPKAAIIERLTARVAELERCPAHLMALRCSWCGDYADPKHHYGNDPAEHRAGAAMNEIMEARERAQEERSARFAAEKRIAELERALDAATAAQYLLVHKASQRAVEEHEAALNPEDVGCAERIAQLQRRIAELESRAAQPASPRSGAEMLLRHEWWLNHGCPISALYGDDGEMQCGRCLVDFGREALDKLHKHVHERRLAAMVTPSGTVVSCYACGNENADQLTVILTGRWICRAIQACTQRIQERVLRGDTPAKAER